MVLAITLMQLAPYLAWIGAALELTAYTYMIKRGDVNPFHWACLIGGIFLSLYNISLSAWPSLAVNLPFTIIALFAVISIRKNNGNP